MLTQNPPSSPDPGCSQDEKLFYQHQSRTEMDGSPPDLSQEYMAQDRGPTARAILWSASSVALFFVVSRCYVRIWRKIFGLDDAIAIVALVLLIAYAAVVHVATRNGLGRHLAVFDAQQPPWDLRTASLLDVSSQPIVLVSCALGKTVFAVTLLRLGVWTWIRVLLWFIIVTINVLHLLIALLQFLRCQDPRTLWVPGVDSDCWDPRVYIVITTCVGSYSAAVDFVLGLLPWVITWRLHGMRKKEKVGIALAMSLGIVAGAIAVVKTTYLSPYGGSEDFTYTHLELIWWAAVENALILIAGSIATLKPLASTISRIVWSPPSETSDSYALNSSIQRKFERFASKGQWSTAEGRILGQGQMSDCQSERGIFEDRGEGSSNANLPSSNTGGEIRGIPFKMAVTEHK